jgi:hypothetical protein
MKFKCGECDQVVSGGDIVWHQAECVKPMPLSRKCYNCEGPVEPEQTVDACKACYRDPSTNTCETCGKPRYVPYPFVCGECLRTPKR